MSRRLSRRAEIPVLDKGFVRLVDAMGDDAAVVLAARVSYAGGLKGEEQDRKLIHFLLRHQHMTPFEHAIFKFHCKTPIFVMRQWIRHRAGSFNEKSARYAEAVDEFYFPDKWRAPATANKQASRENGRIDSPLADRLLRDNCRQSYAAYQNLLRAGVAREMARMALPVNLYTEFYWTVNARNLMHFINLRADAAAQWEIQKYAEALAELFKARMPWTWEAFRLLAWTGKNAEVDGQSSPT